MDFLYDSGLSVGRSDGAASASTSASGGGFKALEQPSSASGNQQSSVPGALFDDKPSSAGDAWRKLHSDPLLLIRQREQEALARVKNNPIKMALIRKSVCSFSHSSPSTLDFLSHFIETALPLCLCMFSSCLSIYAHLCKVSICCFADRLSFI